MKYLVLVLVVVVVLWLLQGKHRAAAPRRAPPKLPPVEDMVSCAHCGLHLPRSEAVSGRGGYFCGEAHRAAYDRHNAPQ